MLPRRARRFRLFPLPVDGILLALILAMMVVMKLFGQAGPTAVDEPVDRAGFLVLLSEAEGGTAGP